MDVTTWLVTLREFQLDDLFATSILARAYDYVPLIQIDHQTRTLLKATVDHKYSTYLSSENSQLVGECSCLYQGPCKHLAALILSGMSG